MDKSVKGLTEILARRLGALARIMVPCAGDSGARPTLQVAYDPVADALVWSIHAFVGGPTSIERRGTDLDAVLDECERALIGQAEEIALKRGEHVTCIRAALRAHAETAWRDGPTE